MTHGHSTSAENNRKLAYLILGLLALYGLSLLAGLPQRGTELIQEAEHHADEHGAEEHADEGHGEQATDETPEEAGAPAEGAPVAPGETIVAAASPAPAPPAKPRPPYWTVLPFVVLLGCIALLPLFRATEHWWESNLHRFYVAAGLGLITLLYYAVFHHSAVEGHWPAHHIAEWQPDQFLNLRLPLEVAANALLGEYIPFIVLLFSLYTLSGGVRIEGNLAAHPMTNAAIIGIGGLLASFVGTTGAAMLLIRLLLDTNRERTYKTHTVVMFIFVVCNCGGCLLPIGDPPLFLGYLHGVPFFWTLGLWEPWLFINGLLVVFYWAWDHFYFYRHEPKAGIRRDESQQKSLQISGLALHGPLLLGVIASVALLDPSKTLPGTDWHPWMYLREAVQLGLVALSLLIGAYAVRAKNHFTYHAILEVAALFIGIFLCMQPALQILNVEGARMGLTDPMHFYLATGGLSSVLDNAPTYVVFFQTAANYGGDLSVKGGSIDAALLAAVSLGAVFFGAMTYIGNGPNFMVKAIAETSGVRMPSFFGYMKYSLGILLPLLLLTAWIFL